MLKSMFTRIFKYDFWLADGCAVSQWETGFNHYCEPTWTLTWAGLVAKSNACCDAGCVKLFSHSRMVQFKVFKCHIDSLFDFMICNDVCDVISINCFRWRLSVRLSTLNNAAQCHTVHIYGSTKTDIIFRPYFSLTKICLDLAGELQTLYCG